MQILRYLEDFSTQKDSPIILTIGNFDGVHRGHSAILKRCQEIASKEGQLIVITFSSHPSEILRPNQPVLFLCTLPHRIKLIESFGAKALILLPFTLSLAKQSATHFIEKVHRFVPFSHLVLGYDAVLGQNRQGNQAMMTELASCWGFELEYLKEYRYEGKSVSSTRIRQLLQEGDVEQVENLLGRPYSIYSTLLAQKQEGEETIIDIDISQLCLPPNGEYQVSIKTKNQISQGIALLKNNFLEIRFFDKKVILKDKEIEVIFHSF
jgi:riboflavin kinase/FMN adenylyltransferase